jgi:hypothetical protein
MQREQLRTQVEMTMVLNRRRQQQVLRLIS